MGSNQKQGQPIRSDGVRTISDLRGRCRIDGQCWHWAGARDANGRGSLWLPAMRRRVSLGVAICVLTTGKPPTAGRYWHVTCETRDCANPAHRKPGDRSSQMLAAGMARDPLQRARIAAGKRLVSKLSDEDVTKIRGSSESLAVLSERFGISKSYASTLRRGLQRWPLAAPGSSVFSFGRLA